MSSQRLLGGGGPPGPERSGGAAPVPTSTWGGVADPSGVAGAPAKLGQFVKEDRPPRVLLAVALGILAVVTVLALTAYPARDDWAWANLGRDAGVADGLTEHWQHWSGRWAYTVVMLVGGLAPSLYVPLYPLWPLLTAGAVVVAGRCLAGSWPWGVVMGAAALLMPQPGEGLFWQSGAVGYVLPLALGAILVTRAWHPSALLVSGMVLGGWTETPALLLAGWCVATLHRPASRWVLAGLVLGMALLVAAPGNAHRLVLVGGWKPLPNAVALGAATVLDLLGQVVAVPWVAALAALAAPRQAAPPPWRAPLLVATAVAAATASCASVGFCEPRQGMALWLHLLVVVLAVAPALPRWAFAIWLAASLILGPLPEGPALICHGLAAVVLLVLVGPAVARRLDPAWALVLTVALAGAPAGVRLAEDALRAPMWRAWLAHRDAAVLRLQQDGARRVTMPVAPGDLRPAVASVGDLISGSDWLGQAWARWHGLEAVRVDPRATAVTAP